MVEYLKYFDVERNVGKESTNNNLSLKILVLYFNHNKNKSIQNFSLQMTVNFVERKDPKIVWLHQEDERTFS